MGSAIVIESGLIDHVRPFTKQSIGEAGSSSDIAVIRYLFDLESFTAKTIQICPLVVHPTLLADGRLILVAGRWSEHSARDL